jgi:hypothetical protein
MANDLVSDVVHLRTVCGRFFGRANIVCLTLAMLFRHGKQWKFATAISRRMMLAG